jgi:3-deoxy-D-manno-octulosonic-acid transferase
MADLHPGLRLYRWLSPLALAALPLGSPFSAKLRTGLSGRRGLLERLVRAAPAVRGAVWFHVSSVGEYEQARPLIEGLRTWSAAGAPPLVVTHFSPSGRTYAERRPAADLHDYLPLDHPARMRRLVAAWRPRVLVFVKFDCWPNLVLAAGEENVPVILLAGTLQPGSARLWPIARSAFRGLFDRFAHLGVCTDEDRERFVDGLGVSCPVSVTGDTRAEQVIRRFEQSAAGPVATRLQALGSRLLILGSTWGPDERLWLPVLPDLLARHADLRVVLAPHEPLPARLEALERGLGEAGIATTRLGSLLASPAGVQPAARCILVDSVGVLAEIYRAGSLAYVGGSFTTGVHNTMEPAVASLPVLFGPVFQNAVEAGVLLRRGAAFIVQEQKQALEVTDGLLADGDELARRGSLARQVVLAQRGATQKSLALLSPYL